MFISLNLKGQTYAIIVQTTDVVEAFVSPDFEVDAPLERVQNGLKRSHV